jgi:hypothetical protein
MVVSVPRTVEPVELLLNVGKVKHERLDLDIPQAALLSSGTETGRDVTRVVFVIGNRRQARRLTTARTLANRNCWGCSMISS